MIKYLRNICLSALFLMSAFSYPQSIDQYTVNKIYVPNSKTIDQEISQGRITDIIEDQRGFIWFGTMDGLNKYDGYTVKIFKNSTIDTTSISNNEIIKLLTDSSGFIWIATANGINKLNPYTEKFSHFTLAKGHEIHTYINDMTLDQDQNLWYSTDDGLFVIRKQKKESEYIRFQEHPISPTALLADHQNKLWIGTLDSIIRCYDFNTKKVTLWPLPFKNHIKHLIKINKIYEDKQHRIWISLQDDWHLHPYCTTFLLESNNQQFVRFNYFKDLLRKNDVGYNFNAISDFDSRENKLWVASTTFEYIFNYDFDKHELNYYKEDHFENNQTRLFGKTNVFIDSKGLIWEGTNGKGINIISNKKHHFSLVDSQKMPKLTIKSIRSFCEDDDNYWFGGYFGLAKMDKISKEITTINQTVLPYTMVNYPLNNRYILIGSEGGGINLVNKETGTEKRIIPSHKFNSSTDYIFSLLLENDSICWAGCGTGTLRINLKTKTYKKYDFQNDMKAFKGRVISIYKDYQHRIWFGSANGILAYYSDSLDQLVTKYDDLKVRLNIGNVTINSITQDQDSIFWLGTSSGLLSIHHDSINQYTEKDQLPSNFVYAVLIDKKGFMWLSTNDGICKINPHHWDVISYSINDHLQNKEFNTGAYYKAKDGTLFFGGINGFNYFNPADIQTKGMEIPIRLVGEKWYNKNVPLSSDMINKSEIVIPPDIGYFKIKVIGINYLNTKNTKYKYRIKELDSGWIELGTVHEIGLQNLKPDTYQLQFIASDNGKNWNQDVFTIKLKIQAHFWQTNWFWGLVILLVIIIISWVIRLRFNLIKNKKAAVIKLVNQRTKELKAANLELKKANETKDHFFTIISHDLKNPMGVALMSIHELKENYNDYDKEDQHKFLDIIGKSVDNMAKLLKDLLTWARMQQEQIIPNLEDVNILNCVNKTLEVLSHNIKEKELNVSVDVNKEDLLKIDKNIFSTIIRNLISNAIKFTHNGGNIAVTAIKSSQEIVIKISDNGIGIPDHVLKHLFIPGGVISHRGTNNERGTGMGLVLLKEFVDLSNGKIWVESSLGKGSTFFVSFPILATKKKST